MVRPAIVNVPVRCDVLVDAAMLNVTPPLPVPVAPDVTVIQLSWICAVQPQPLLPVTVVQPVRPP